MPIVVRLAGIDVVREHGQKLLEAHWQEIALNKRVMRLDPDWHRYYALEEQGSLLTLIACPPEDEEHLVGYSVNFLQPHLHYRDLFTCANDVLFVTKEQRRTGLGPRLILATETAAIDHGAKFIMWHAKQSTALDALLPKMGYGVQDIVYSKELS